MNVGRTLPPAAAPIALGDIARGVVGALRGDTAVQEFCRQLKEHFQVRNCLLVSSGTAALTLILEALREVRPERDEVLIPAFTCYTVPSAIIRAGLKIRLCDIDPATLDFNPTQLQALLEECPKLLAVIPTHLFGFPADVARVKHWAHRQEVFVVEDAAQAMGGEGASGLLGTQGDVGFFSLGRGKALSTVEGGIILTDNDDIAERVRRKVHRLPACTAADGLRLLLYSLALVLLQHPALYWFPRSLPFLRLGETRFDCDFPLRRFSGFQAGLAIHWKGKLAKLRQLRQELVRSWLSRLPAAIRPLNSSLDVPLLRFPVRVNGCSGEEAVGDRGAVLGIARSYPTAVQEIPSLRHLFPEGSSPVARQLARQLVTLPTHRYVTSRDQDRILAHLTRMVHQG